MDDALAGSEIGIRAVKISLVGLGLTAIMQLVVAVASGSVAVLADTIHNFADASTAIPLWLAFWLSTTPPTTATPTAMGAPKTWRACSSC